MNSTYARQIRRMIKRIPTDFPCEPGCTDCCNSHTWTWCEWEPVQDKHYAVHRKGRCPYATAKGCMEYEHRPIICRLYGNAGSIGKIGPFENVSLACPRGIKPVSPLTREQARDIFLKYIGIVHKEAQDMANENASPIFAGPYGAYIK